MVAQDRRAGEADERAFVGGELALAPTNLADWRQTMVRELTAAGIETPDLDVRLLMCAICGVRPADLIARGERAVNAAEVARLKGALERRKAGEPVSRIIGSRQFWGLEFLVTPATLDPRPDSETVVEAALAIIDAEGWRAGRDGRGFTILDIGTGTGCLLLSLLNELPGAHGVGVDLSLDALRVAAENARLLGLRDRASFVQTSFLDGLIGPFDLVIANPPYIPSEEIARLDRPVRDYDPKMALDGGFDGLEAMFGIIRGLPQVLHSGWVVLEIGAGQAQGVAELLRDGGLELGRPGLGFRADLGGITRCVAAKSRNSP